MAVAGSEPLLRVERLTKTFDLKRGKTLIAVNDVSFSLQRGETLGLVGESGSGKTSVGRCILRLIEPTSGSIYLDGKNLTTLTPRALRSARARIQLVFQDPFGSLDPRVSIGASLREPLNIHHVDHGAGDGRIRQMLDLVGLPYDVVHALPADLTTSEQQRVGIARALVTRPDLVILDEPTSQLDSTARSALLRTLKDIQAELKTAYIFISHDLNSVAKISHRIAIMYLGCLVEVAPTENIIASQRHPYSRALLSAVLFPDPSRKPDRYVIQGEISSAIETKDECQLYPRCPIREEACSRGKPPLVEIAASHQSACRRWGHVS